MASRAAAAESRASFAGALLRYTERSRLIDGDGVALMVSAAMALDPPEHEHVWMVDAEQVESGFWRGESARSRNVRCELCGRSPDEVGA